MGANASFEVFTDMNHGWSTRGDLGVENVKRDVYKAVDCLVDHFKKHLK